MGGDRVTALCGSDTGNAEGVTEHFQLELKRSGMKATGMALEAKGMAFNEVDVSDVPDEPKFLVIVATAGQGNLPEAAVKCWNGWSRS